MYIIDVSLQKFIFKEVLEMTGTDTFTAFRLKTWSKFQAVV